MLSLARIESGALHLTLEPVQVADAVAAAAERLKRTAPDRTVDWDARRPASAFSPTGTVSGQISTTCSITPIVSRHPVHDQRAGHSAGPGQCGDPRVDHGPGVPAAMRERLFNRFVKGRRMPRRHRAGARDHARLVRRTPAALHWKTAAGRNGVSLYAAEGDS